MHNHPFATRPKPDECECCTNSLKGEWATFFKDMWLCKECWSKDSFIAPMLPQPVKPITPITVRTDIFNAVCNSIEELRVQIESDESVQNKHYTLAEILQTKINDYKKVIFDLNESLVNTQNELRGTQEYLNTLAVKLRSEEREKLRLMDAAYSPKPLTKIPKPVIVKTKFNRNQLRKVASELSEELGVPIPEHMVQVLAVKRGSMEKAISEIRITIRQIKSEVANDQE
jgi:hypothetical protein